MENEISVLNWRMGRGIPSGVHIWFDPSCESVRLFRVPSSVQVRALQEELEEVAGRGEPGYLDKVDSVSGRGDGDGVDSKMDALDPPGLDQEDLPF